MALKIIRFDDDFDDERIARELSVDDVAWVPESGSVWTRSGDGEVAEISPSDHPDFVIDGQVYAWHPDEGTTADHASCAGDFGHIENMYFAYYSDEWIGLGQASSADEGLDLLRDRLGVLDPSWIYLEDSSR